VNDRLTEWETVSLSERPSHWVRDRLTEWATVSLSERPSHWVRDRLAEWETVSLSERPSHWVSDRLTEWESVSLSERPSHWVRDRLPEWATVSLSERPSHWVSRWNQYNSGSGAGNAFLQPLYYNNNAQPALVYAIWVVRARVSLWLTIFLSQFVLCVFQLKMLNPLGDSLELSPLGHEVQAELKFGCASSFNPGHIFRMFLG